MLDQRRRLSLKHCTFIQCWASVADVGLALKQHWINVPFKYISCNQFGGYINAVNLYSIGYCWPTLDRPRHARLAVESFFNM